MLKLTLLLLAAAACFAAEVNLGYEWITDADIRNLAHQKDLRKLDLSLSMITDKGVEEISKLPTVTDLNLYAVEHITDTALAFLRNWKQLERLNLRGTDITDTSLEYIAGLPNLRSLDISFTQVTNNGTDYLASLRDLEDLYLGGNKITGAGLHVLKVLPKLTRLELGGDQKRNTETWSIALTDFDLEAIGKLSQLQSLNLRGIKITGLGVAHLKALTRLETLDVSATRVTDSGLQELVELPRLHRLNLWTVKGISDAGMAAVSKMKALEILDLSETPITDQGLNRLAGDSALKVIYLTGSKVTAEGVERFRRTNPKCKVDWVATT